MLFTDRLRNKRKKQYVVEGVRLDEFPNGGGNVFPHTPEEEERCPHDVVSIYFEAHHVHEGFHGQYHEGLDLLPHGGKYTMGEKNKNIIKEIVDPTTISRMWPMLRSPNSSTI